jgi:hypothetical protein
MPSRIIRWSITCIQHCLGLAVLPGRGILIASSYDSNELVAIRIADGTEAAKINVARPVFIAINPSTSTIFVTSNDKSVYVLQWEGLAFACGCFERLDAVVPTVVKSTSDESAFALAVMPPAPGKTIWQLLIGETNTCCLRVLALPELSVVSDLTLDFKIKGLVADPTGEALAVSDSVGEAIHVLRWPVLASEVPTT